MELGTLQGNCKSLRTWLFFWGFFPRKNRWLFCVILQRCMKSYKYSHSRWKLNMAQWLIICSLRRAVYLITHTLQNSEKMPADHNKVVWCQMMLQCVLAVTVMLYNHHLIWFGFCSIILFLFFLFYIHWEQQYEHYPVPSGWQGNSVQLWQYKQYCLLFYLVWLKYRYK